MIHRATRCQTDSRDDVATVAARGDTSIAEFAILAHPSRTLPGVMDAFLICVSDLYNSLSNIEYISQLTNLISLNAKTLIYLKRSPSASDF